MFTVATAVDFSQADDFINEGSNNKKIESFDEIGEEFSTIGDVLTYIGAGILVGATAYMGILYMISPPDKQAKLKEQSIGLLVSAIVIFGAYGIWRIIVNILDTAMN